MCLRNGNIQLLWNISNTVLFVFRSHSRGRAQADDEDSMDATDVTPTPDFDIAFEIGENCFLLILLWQFCICNNIVKGICVSELCMCSLTLICV